MDLHFRVQAYNHYSRVRSGSSEGGRGGGGGGGGGGGERDHTHIWPYMYPTKFSFSYMVSRKQFFNEFQRKPDTPAHIPAHIRFMYV